MFFACRQAALAFPSIPKSKSNTKTYEFIEFFPEPFNLLKIKFS